MMNSQRSGDIDKTLFVYECYSCLMCYFSHYYLYYLFVVPDGGVIIIFRSRNHTFKFSTYIQVFQDCENTVLNWQFKKREKKGVSLNPDF